MHASIAQECNHGCLHWLRVLERSDGPAFGNSTINYHQYMGGINAHRLCACSTDFIRNRLVGYRNSVAPSKAQISALKEEKAICFHLRTKSEL